MHLRDMMMHLRDMMDLMHWMHLRDMMHLSDLMDLRDMMDLRLVRRCHRFLLLLNIRFRCVVLLVRLKKLGLGFAN
jgi:hypothetical protein